jgi:hypothetical protein
MGTMIRTLLICAVVSASALGCSTTQQRPDAQATASTANANPCVQHSASRIPPRPGECSAPGRTYSDTDIRNTGQTNLADALQMLDPSVSVHH